MGKLDSFTTFPSASPSTPLSEMGEDTSNVGNSPVSTEVPAAQKTNKNLMQREINGHNGKEGEKREDTAQNDAQTNAGGNDMGEKSNGHNSVRNNNSNNLNGSKHGNTPDSIMNTNKTNTNSKSDSETSSDKNFSVRSSSKSVLHTEMGEQPPANKGEEPTTASNGEVLPLATSKGEELPPASTGEELPPSSTGGVLPLANTGEELSPANMREELPPTGEGRRDEEVHTVSDRLMLNGEHTDEEIKSSNDIYNGDSEKKESNNNAKIHTDNDVHNYNEDSNLTNGLLLSSSAEYEENKKYTAPAHTPETPASYWNSMHPNNEKIPMDGLLKAFDKEEKIDVYEDGADACNSNFTNNKNDESVKNYAVDANSNHIGNNNDAAMYYNVNMAPYLPTNEMLYGANHQHMQQQQYVGYTRDSSDNGAQKGYNDMIYNNTHIVQEQNEFSNNQFPENYSMRNIFFNGRVGLTSYNSDEEPRDQEGGQGSSTQNKKRGEGEMTNDNNDEMGERNENGLNKEEGLPDGSQNLAQGGQNTGDNITTDKSDSKKIKRKNHTNRCRTTSSVCLFMWCQLPCKITSYLKEKIFCRAVPLAIIFGVLSFAFWLVALCSYQWRKHTLKYETEVGRHVVTTNAGLLSAQRIQTLYRHDGSLIYMYDEPMTYSQMEDSEYCAPYVNYDPSFANKFNTLSNTEESNELADGIKTRLLLPDDEDDGSNNNNENDEKKKGVEGGGDGAVMLSKPNLRGGNKESGKRQFSDAFFISREPNAIGILSENYAHTRKELLGGTIWDLECKHLNVFRDAGFTLWIIALIICILQAIGILCDIYIMSYKTLYKTYSSNNKDTVISHNNDNERLSSLPPPPPSSTSSSSSAPSTFGRNLSTCLNSDNNKSVQWVKYNSTVCWFLSWILLMVGIAIWGNKTDKALCSAENGGSEICALGGAAVFAILSLICTSACLLFHFATFTNKKNVLNLCATCSDTKMKCAANMNKTKDTFSFDRQKTQKYERKGAHIINTDEDEGPLHEKDGQNGQAGESGYLHINN